MNPKWVTSQKSHIWIFNVGRGLAIFLRTALNQGILYDLGASDDFSPLEFLKKNIVPYLDRYKDAFIAQIILSHPHVDHIADIDVLVKAKREKSMFYSSLHTCPHDKVEGSEKPEVLNWKRIKNPSGSQRYIDSYKMLYEGRTLPLQTICYDSNRYIPNLEYGLFYIRPPVVESIHPQNDQEYGNGISLVLYYRHGYHSILIPGDISPDSLKYLLNESDGHEKRFTRFERRQNELHPDWHLKTGDQPSLKNILKEMGLSILIAPHHGLQSGYCEELYDSMKDKKPGLVIISEKRHLSDTNGEVCSLYQSERGGKGQDIFIEGKKERCVSVSTRNGHHILILFQGTGGNPEIYLEKDPEMMLKRLS
jgi:hypothetical protein